MCGCSTKALEVFENLYPELTGGAQFDQYSGLPLNDAFNATSQALHRVGYDGIIVIWDEFGRFLESGASEAFGWADEKKEKKLATIFSFLTLNKLDQVC